jgi:enamine deaminase RidA (YjgF/YER057c/UK114 family)
MPSIESGRFWDGGRAEAGERSMGAEQRIRDLGIELPPPVEPVASYVRWVQTGNLLFISGTGPGNETQRGKLGSTMSVDEGYQAAREVGLQILATARAALGDLDRVRRVVKILGMVNCTPDFEDQPKVINGCSDLFIEIFGEAGKHTRSAVGFVALPNQIPVEIECTMEVS